MEGAVWFLQGLCVDVSISSISILWGSYIQMWRIFTFLKLCWAVHQCISNLKELCGDVLDVGAVYMIPSRHVWWCTTSVFKFWGFVELFLCLIYLGQLCEDEPQLFWSLLFCFDGTSMSCVEKHYQAALYGAVYKVPLPENPAYQLLMRCADVSPSHALEVGGLGCVNIGTA